MKAHGDQDLAPAFAPFSLRPGAELPPAWLRWLGAALPGAASAPPPPGDPAPILPALAAHGIAPLVYLAVNRAGGWRGWPAAAQAALTEAYRQNALRSFLMAAELERVAGALAAGAVPVALLKGAALGRTIYESPAARVVNDLDLLIPAAQVEAARRTLTGLGYRAPGLPGSGRFGRWQRRYRAELPMICAQPDERRGLLVELHWSLVELPYYIERIPMADIWATVSSPGLLAGAGPAGLPVPDPATLLLHSCAHLALHHSRSLRLIWLVDVDRLAQARALDWDALTGRAARWGLGLAVYAALKTTAAWLDTPLPQAALARLAQQAEDPIGRAMWGVGDETPGGARRRAQITWAAFTGRQRLRYAAWLGLRALTRPFEAARRA